MNTTLMNEETLQMVRTFFEEAFPAGIERGSDEQIDLFVTAAKKIALPNEVERSMAESGEVGIVANEDKEKALGFMQGDREYEAMTWSDVAMIVLEPATDTREAGICICREYSSDTVVTVDELPHYTVKTVIIEYVYSCLAKTFVEA